MSVIKNSLWVWVLLLNGCSSFRITEEASGGRNPSSATKAFSSMGILSEGAHINDSALLESKLSDEFFTRKIRSLTASNLFPGMEQKPYSNLVKILKRENFTSLLVIRNVVVQSETSAPLTNYPTAFSGQALTEKQQTYPFQTLSADISLVDLSTNATVWSARLDVQDTALLPTLLEKTATGIAKTLEKHGLLNPDRELAKLK